MSTVQFPNTPVVGDAPVKLVNGVDYVWDGEKWSYYGSSGGNTSIDSGVLPPSDAKQGDLWFNADNGIMYIYFNDGNSVQWVDVRPGGSGGGGNTTIDINIPTYPDLP